MGNDVTEVMETLPPPSAVKVHRLMCLQLLKLVDGVGKIYPEIEAARPRCLSGIQALCLLSNAFEKAKLLIQDCSESSKLYLAIKGDVILSRCKKARTLLDQSLSQIQHMVPVMLASEISRIISDLRSVTFNLDPSEEEAGKVMKTLHHQYASAKDSVEVCAMQSIKIAALRLHITSGKAILIEKRSIKNLLDQVGDSAPAKKQILLFLLNLLKKYEKSIVGGQMVNACVEHEDSVPFGSFHGQSVEIKYSTRYVPDEAQVDSFMQSKTVNSQETSLTSIDSFSGSMYNVSLAVHFSNVSLGSLGTSQNSDSLKKTLVDSHTLLTTDSCSRDGEYLHKLDELPWASQCKMVEDVKDHLKYGTPALQLASHENFVEPLTKFLKEAFDLYDVKAQRDGCLSLLAFVTKCRTAWQCLDEDVYDLLALFLNSEITEEAISILEVLSNHQYCRSKVAASGAITSILQILEIQITELHKRAIRILYNLSFDNDIHSQILSRKFVRELVPYFEDGSLASYCITILKNLCDHEITKASIVETDRCIASVAKLLEMDSCEIQEHAVALLLSICSQSDQHYQLLMDEGVIPALVRISISGNDKGKENAMELLRLFGDISYNDDMQERQRSDLDFSEDSRNYGKEQKPSSRPPGFFRKISICLKSAAKKKI